MRLSFGETDWHPVKRGLAQGAVESPWLYDGLTEELKRRGVGIRIAGVLVPLRFLVLSQNSSR